MYIVHSISVLLTKSDSIVNNNALPINKKISNGKKKILLKRVYRK